MKKTIINLIGPSGAGKTTLGRELIKIGVPELVSHTSRDVRDGEIDGVSYYFVKEDTIIDMIEKNEVVEHTLYAGNRYCLSKKEIEDKLNTNDTVFAITDINGTQHLKSYFDNVVVVFIYTGVEALELRMRNRGESEDVIKKRIDQLVNSKELENYKCADYVINNIDYDKSVNSLMNILNEI